MKLTSILMSLFLFSLVGKSGAQTTNVISGIYLTKDDFKSNKLIEEAECKNEKEKFERHDFFSRQEFVVINKGKTVAYQKKDIYAYRDCENTVWRFYNNKEYEILETKSIYIYRREQIVMNGIAIEKDPVYYFSNGCGGDVKELSIENLKLTYSTNQAFRNMLDAEFKSNKDATNLDPDIYLYDVLHKMYKVNYLFDQSKK